MYERWIRKDTDGINWAGKSELVVFIKKEKETYCRFGDALCLDWSTS